MLAVIVAGVLSVTTMVALNVPRDPLRPHPELLAEVTRQGAPPWAGVEWDDQEDQRFREIKAETLAFGRTVPRTDPAGQFHQRFLEAYDRWERDHRNPAKLFTASLLFGMGEYADAKFHRRTEISTKVQNLKQGWMYLRKPPKSYEFVRRGYVLNTDTWQPMKFGDLGSRLIKRNPLDRVVILAMGREYVNGSKSEQFENEVIDRFRALSSTKDWKPWDEARFAAVMVAYGRRHFNADAVRIALVLYREAKARTWPHWDASWMDTHIRMAEDELKKLQPKKSP